MVGLLGLLATICTWLWVQYLPGYFVSRWLVPDARGMARHGLALITGFSVVPLALFLLGSLVSQPLSSEFLWASASIVNLAAGALAFRRGTALFADLTVRDSVKVCAVSLASALFIVLGFRGIDAGDVLTTIQHCLYVISLHGIQSHPSESLALYDRLTDDFMHFLIHHDSAHLSGLSQLLYEQRIGNVPLLSPPVALYGMGGWFIATVHATVVTAICSYLAIREAGAAPWSSALSSALLVWAGHILCGYFLNENYFALAMVSFLVWTSLRGSWSVGWLVLVGLVGGHLVGVRHTSVLFLPALAVAIVWAPGFWRHRLRHLGLAALCAGVAVAPWLYINTVMLGNPLTHPKIQPDSDGRVVENVFLGFRFLFKPLNWPFTDAVVRTVWNPFPTFLWLPLLVTRAFGQVATAIGLMGLARAWADRRLVVVLAMFALPHWLALSLLEGVDWEQISYVTPGLVPFVVALAFGLESLGDRRRALAVLAITAVVALGSSALRSIDVPVDPRTQGPLAGAGPVEMAPGTRSVAERLTRFAPLPQQPHWRLDGLARDWASLGAVVRPVEVPVSEESGLPIYASGRAIMLSAYYKGTVRSYDFEVAAGPLRTSADPVRTAVWLHTVSLRLKAERLKVHVERHRTRYDVELVGVGESDEYRDFTFWLNPWDPPIRTIQVQLDGERIEDLRILTYGGELEYGERLHILTNYEKEVLDVVEVPFEVNNVDEGGCGLWVFLSGVDGSRIETLSPGGAFDMKWNGDARGVLRLPRNMLSERVVLASDPYCGEHVPQYGDRFGIAEGAPFGPNRPIRIDLDGTW